jgi:processive 1,2-diacylglycerol beta-glucosyltransferase
MKILVIHATAGAGHKKAAEAIYNGLRSKGTHDVKLVDALDYTNPIFKITYPETYTFLVTKMSWAWGFFFALLDIPAIQPFVHLVRRIYNGLNAGKLQKFLKEEKFDCIITTQFLSAEVSAYLKRTGQIKSKVICVVTDFDVHRIWINQGIDVYACACDSTKAKLIELGIPEGHIAVTGIPTDAKFSAAYDKGALQQKLGLKPDVFTILVATGSFGMGPIEELIKSLWGYQLLIVCGHNKSLYQRLKPLAEANTHVYGLVNNMDELMSVADIMVTKPGGLSIAEALVKRLPMIFFSAIPGQETNNIKVLKSYGACEDQLSIEKIMQHVDGLNSSPANLDVLRMSLSPLSKPSAVSDIIKLI